MKKISLKVVSACLISGVSLPIYALNLADADKEVLPPMIIEGDILTPGFVGIKPDMGGVNDAAALLKRVPGVNVNSNGPLSGIAQYRGLFYSRGGVSNFNYKGLIADEYAVNTEFSYQDIQHQMNNYSMRGTTPSKARRESNNSTRGFGYKTSIDIPPV